MQDIFGIPDGIVTYNRLVVDGSEVMCVFLKSFAYPCRYLDIVSIFGTPVPQYSIITNQIMDSIYNNFHDLLENMNQSWLRPGNLELFCEVIHNKGAALNNRCGFIDGTVRPFFRPGKMQRVLYNGHKKVHGLKFQSVLAGSCE